MRTDAPLRRPTRPLRTCRQGARPKDPRSRPTDRVDPRSCWPQTSFQTTLLFKTSLIFECPLAPNERVDLRHATARAKLTRYPPTRYPSPDHLQLHGPDARDPRLAGPPAAGVSSKTRSSCSATTSAASPAPPAPRWNDTDALERPRPGVGAGNSNGARGLHRRWGGRER